MKTKIPTNTYERLGHKPMTSKMEQFAHHKTLNPKHEGVLAKREQTGKLSPKLEAIRARGVNFAKSK